MYNQSKEDCISYHSH